MASQGARGASLHWFFQLIRPKKRLSAKSFVSASATNVLFASTLSRRGWLQIVRFFGDTCKVATAFRALPKAKT
jgi:hypothetical protein